MHPRPCEFSSSFTDVVDHVIAVFEGTTLTKNLTSEIPNSGSNISQTELHQETFCLKYLAGTAIVNPPNEQNNSKNARRFRADAFSPPRAPKLFIPRERLFHSLSFPFFPAFPISNRRATLAFLFVRAVRAVGFHVDGAAETRGLVFIPQGAEREARRRL